MPYVMSGTVKIYYEMQGTGRPVVFVHGAGGNHAAWWQQVASLRSEYCVVTVDLRGFGNSDTVADGPDSLDFPADIEAVLDAAGVDGAVLVGQSIGSVAALRFAVKNPGRVAAVVLAHSVGGLDDPNIAALAKADRTDAEKLPILDRLLTKRFQQSEPARTFLFQQLGTFNRATMRDLRNTGAPGPKLDDVVACGVKILFLTGEMDNVLRPATVRAAHERVPGSRFTVVASAPHSMYWEAPELFNSALRSFLQELHGGT